MESQSQQSSEVDPVVDEILQQIHDRSKGLAVLYTKLAETEALPVPGNASDPVESERLRLQKTNPQSEGIRREIQQITAELMKLGERLETHRGGLRESLTPQEKEKHSLQRRLSKLADDQNAAVRRWNRDPSPDQRQAFEEELWRLHREYSEVLDQLKTQKRGGVGTASLDISSS